MNPPYLSKAKDLYNALPLKTREMHPVSVKQKGV